MQYHQGMFCHMLWSWSTNFRHVYAFLEYVCFLLQQLYVALAFLPSIYEVRISSITSGPVLWRKFVCHCRSLCIHLASFLTFFLSPEFVPSIRECLEISLMSVGLQPFYDDIAVHCLRRSEVKRLPLKKKKFGWFLLALSALSDDNSVSIPQPASIGSE